MAVDQLHPSYTDGIRAVKRCRDVYQGQSAIKATDADGITSYFPMYATVDTKRYNRVIELSSFTNFTGHTVDKLVGAAFREEPKTDIVDNTNIAYLIEDSDGSGGDLEQTATNVVQQVTIAGRHGLLANYPSTAGQVLSKEEVKQLDLKASIVQYPAESIVNWGFSNGQLSYVVLLESKRDETDDLFSHDSKVGRRVYYIHDDDKCYQQFVEDNGDFNAADGEPVSNFGGKGLTYIPFIIVGSVDNTPTVDKPPISGMCDVNIAHYQLSVIETENLSIHGQMTLGLSTDMTVQEFKEANPNGIQVGSNVGLNLGPGGSFHTATIDGSTALPAAKEAKKQELIALGANLIDKSESNKTATEASINAKEQTSIMINVVNNVSDAIEICANWCEDMMVANPKGDAEYRINTEFFDQTISPELFTAFLNGVDRGMFSQDEMKQIKQQSFPTILMGDELIVNEQEAE